MFLEDFMIDFIFFNDNNVLRCCLHLQINNCFRNSCFIDHFICAQSREVEQYEALRTEHTTRRSTLPGANPYFIGTISLIIVSIILFKVYQLTVYQNLKAINIFSRKL